MTGGRVRRGGRLPAALDRCESEQAEGEQRRGCGFGDVLDGAADLGGVVKEAAAGPEADDEIHGVAGGEGGGEPEALHAVREYHLAGVVDGDAVDQHLSRDS